MKKTTKGLLSALLLTAMCGTVGCKPKESSTVTPSTGTQISSTSTQQVTVEAQNLLSSIVDSGDGCYTVTEADGKTTVAFNKPAGKEWSSAKVDLTGMTNKDKMSTLRFKVSGVGKLVLKFEGSAGTAQVEIFIYESASKYEWSLLDDVAKITDAHSLFIFAAGGGAGEGSVIFEELTLTPDVAGDDTSYQIITTNYKNFIDGPHVYDGISKDFHFNWDWACNDGDVYEFTYGDNGIKVDYSKPVVERDWAYALTPVAGDFSKMNYLNFRVTGTASKNFTAKVAQADSNKTNVPGFEDGHFKFSGEEDTFSVDISGLTPEAKRLIGNVFFFAEGGSYGDNVKGSFMLHDAWFSQQIPDTAKENKYVGGDDFNVNMYWTGDSIFSVNEANGKTTVSWEGAAPENRWTNINAPYKGDVSVFGELEYSITLPANSAIRMSLPGAGDLGDLVNVDNSEAKTFTGYFDLSKFTKEKLAATDKVMIFPLATIDESKPDGQKECTVPATGSLEIAKLRFVNGRIFVNEENGVLDLSTADWYGDTNYTATSDENGTKLHYTKDKGAWAAFKMRIDGSVLEKYNTVTFEVTGPEGADAIVKFEGESGGANEKKWENNVTTPFTGEKETVTLSLSMINECEAIQLWVWADFLKSGVEGDIVIHSMTFSYVEPEA